MGVKLSDICWGITDGSHNPPAGGSKSPYIMISSKNLNDNHITYDEPRYLSAEQFRTEDKRTRITPGDVLMTIVGTVGRTAVVDDKSPPITLQRSVAVLHPKQELCNSRYLMYLLRSKRSFFEAEAHGVAQRGLYLKQLSEVRVNVPDIRLQLRIVQVLDVVKRIMENRQTELQRLDDLIKARFVEMFGTVHNNAYGFAIGTLESVAEDFFAGGDKPSDCSEKQDNDHPYPVYANGYENGGLQGYSTKCRVSKPSVTISARGTIGYCFIREAGFTPVVRLITIVPNGRVSVVYLKYAIDTMDIKSSGTSQAQLTVPDFRKEEIIVPPWDLQKQFSSFVSQVDKSKFAIQQALNETQKLFDSLMQQYFG